MGRVRVIDFLTDNICLVRASVRAGIMPNEIIHHISVYSFYKSTANLKSKMDRYSMTAEELKLSESTIRNIVSKMEKTIDV